MHALCCHFADQRSNILVDQIVRTGNAAVIADQRFGQSIGLDLFEQTSRRHLRTMAREKKERDISGLRLAEMFSERVNNLAAGGLLVQQAKSIKAIISSLQK